MSLAIASVYLDRAVLEKHLLQSIVHLGDVFSELFLIEGTKGAKPSNIASFYNRVLDETAARFVLFTHPDVEFSKEVCETMKSAFSAGNVGAVGLVGVDGPGKYVWSNQITSQREVDSIDACALMVDKTQQMRFDEKTFDELHLYVEDYCFLARSKGLHCVVVPSQHFLHASSTMSCQGACWGAYRKYRRRLEEKWGKEFRIVVT